MNIELKFINNKNTGTQQNQSSLVQYVKVKEDFFDYICERLTINKMINNGSTINFPSSLLYFAKFLNKRNTYTNPVTEFRIEILFEDRELKSALLMQGDDILKQKDF